MSRIQPPDRAVHAVMSDLTADLHDIAVTVERVSAVLDPTMELLEASHAIHRALVLLIDWSSSRA